MKLAFIGGRDIRSIGGIENWMRHLPAEMAARGHDVTVYCESDRDAVRYEGEVKVVSVKAPRNRYLCKIWASRRATAMALHSGCQLIHYNVWPSAVWSFLAERKGVKTILMGHGFEWRRSKYDAFQRLLLRLCEALSARRHRHIILCSQEQTDWYIRHYGCAGKAVTIPSAVHLPPLSPSAPEPDARSLADASPVPHPYTLLYMGRISPEKNVDLLVRAFSRARLSESAPSAFPAPATAVRPSFSLAVPRLLLAGTMDTRSEYGRRVMRLVEANEAVEYVGEVFDAQKDALLRRTDLFCLPSSLEGLSVALLEAVSYRIPVIASDIPSNREALGDAALWVPPEDEAALEAVFREVFAGIPSLRPDLAPASCGKLAAAEDPQSLRQQLSRNAASAYDRLAARFTWDRTAARYDEYIRSL